MDLNDGFIPAITATLTGTKKLADRAIAQVSDDQLRVALGEEGNSILVIMKHVGGNLASRWTDFLTSDGEKPWRDRDSEFVDTFASREEALEHWEKGWTCLFDSLAALRPEDLEKSVMIRGESQSVPAALIRSMGHTCYHLGQIVELARYQAGDSWESLSIPRGESQAYNQAMWGKHDDRR